MGRICLVIAALTVPLIIDGVAAQDLPVEVDPGVIDKRFEPSPVPRSTFPEGDLVPDEAEEPPEGAAAETLVLKGIVLDGNTVFDDRELAPIWQPHLGKTVPLSLLWDIRAQITVRYRNAGYILSQAVIEAQEIEDGVVHISIVEGFIDNIIIEGEVSGSRRQIEAKLDKIKEARPLRANVLERYMLLLNDLPGVAAESVLRPSPIQQGASELVVFVEEDRFAGALSSDNYGSRFLGRAAGGATAIANNMFGVFDSTELRSLITAQTSELLFLSLAHTLPIMTEGTLATLAGSYVRTEPGSTLEDDEIKGRSYGFSLVANHPFIRTRSTNLSFAGGIRTRDSKTDAAGFDVSEDKIRALTASTTYDFIDFWRGINLFGIEVSQGLDVLGARGKGDNDPPPSRANGRVDFTKVEIGAVREQALMRGWSIQAALKAQYALNPLLASEQFGFGGEEFGRGFDSFEISGDRGLATKIQLQYGSPSFIEGPESHQVYTFFDFGRTWIIEADGGDDEDTATSAGAGVRVNFSPQVNAKLEMGIPLNRNPTDRKQRKGEPRFNFRLAWRF